MFRIVAVFVLAVNWLLLSAIPGIGVEAGEIHEFSVDREYTTQLHYRCILSLPDGYEKDLSRRWPLILFLHGGGMPDPERLQKTILPLTGLPAVVVAPICPPSSDGPLYTNWDWKQLGEVVRAVDKSYRIDDRLRSVIGFSMGGSGAWELPFYEPKLFSKCVVIAGVCHPWSLRHYPQTKVWVFMGTQDYMRKEQMETVSSAKRFGVDVVSTSWTGADHGGIFKNAISYQRMLNWLVADQDLRTEADPSDQ